MKTDTRKRARERLDDRLAPLKPVDHPIPSGDRTFARLFLAALRDAGFRVAIDDFGSGYSNLGQLLQVPFDMIKIDRSLLVIRPCYLALMRAQRLGVRPHGIVLVDEPGRALGPDDSPATLAVACHSMTYHGAITSQAMAPAR